MNHLEMGKHGRQICTPIEDNLLTPLICTNAFILTPKFILRICVPCMTHRQEYYRKEKIHTVIFFLFVKIRNKQYAVQVEPT